MARVRSPVRSQLHRFGLARDRLNFGLVRKVGLSPTGLHALEHLEAAGPLRPTELGERLGLTSGAVTALIDRLETAGWVERRADPNDRRSLTVGLTPTAEAAGRTELGAYEDDVEAAIARLPDTEREIAARFLAAMADVAERHAERIRRA